MKLFEEYDEPMDNTPNISDAMDMWAIYSNFSEQKSIPITKNFG